MADRHQPSSSSSSQQKTQNYDNNSHQNNSDTQYRNSHSDKPKQFQPTSNKRFESVKRPITNVENDHGVPAMAIFCQFNPQHVVSALNKRDHERYDCPDRTWTPGQPRVQYHDLDI